MHRPEPGRRREEHDVDAAVDHCLVRIKSQKPAFGLHANLVLPGVGFFDCLQALRDSLWIDVGDRRENRVVVGLQGLRRRARAAASATDKADPDLLSRLCCLTQACGAGRRNALEEAAARWPGGSSEIPVQ